MDSHQYAIKAPLIMVKSVFFRRADQGPFAFAHGQFASAKAAVEAVKHPDHCCSRNEKVGPGNLEKTRGVYQSKKQTKKTYTVPNKSKLG